LGGWVSAPSFGKDSDEALVTHVLGARPNFMKAAPVIHALGEVGVEQMLIHTGQQYDARMSDAFFADLGLPEPDVNLQVGSGPHGERTAGFRRTSAAGVAADRR
jgi:UDP-N-acetylglucosamine 2-epimerase (non-hydrolysing)